MQADPQLVGTTLHLSLSIPQGNDGVQGLQGINGTDGATGQPRPQGEVTMQQFNAALADALAAAATAAATNSSANSNEVATLNAPFAYPDAEALRVKMNEMLTALWR